MTLAPVTYIPHGGGPLPLLHDAAHANLAAFLQELPRTWTVPDAIVLFSAHWEEEAAVVTGSAAPELLYDYSGFPPAAYSIEYPAPGHVSLADEIVALLREADIEARADSRRGFDHGMFVPLKLMFPEANVPCVQVSLRAGLDPAWHVRVGRQLLPLRQRNIALVGSGMSFHNMRALFGPDAASREQSERFSDWLISTCTEPGLSHVQREQRLLQWRAAPGGLFCHPREEHLLPLHMCFGAVSDGEDCEVVFDQALLGHRTVAFVWH